MNTKDLLKRGAGAVMLVVGLALSAWLAYNLFVHRTAEFDQTATSDRGSFKAFIFTGGLAFFGGSLLFGKSSAAATPRDDVSTKP